MKVQGMVNPGGFSVEQIPETNKSLIRLFQNVETFKDADFEGFRYDEYHVEVETWDGIEENVRENYAEFLKKGKDNEVDRSNDAILRKADEATDVAAIVFVTLAESGSIDAATAAEHAEKFSEWAYPVAYKAGAIRRFEGRLYQCLQAHTSQESWTPSAAASLWKQIADPSEEWPAWSQPIAAMDTYRAGDKASHAGKKWTSDLDNNVWEPGVYGWTEAAEDVTE